MQVNNCNLAQLEHTVAVTIIETLKILFTN